MTVNETAERIKAMGTTKTPHQRAIRFFWSTLFGAAAISLAANVTHAVLGLIPHVCIQIAAAAVPPIALLACTHGIGLAVRAGVGGRVYGVAVAATVLIGVGAFALSFAAQRGLMIAIGYSAATAWILPLVVDASIAISTTMLVALGDKPVRRTGGGAGQAAPVPKAPVPKPVPQAVPKQAVHKQAVPKQRASKAAVTKPMPKQAVHNSDVQADTELARELVTSGVTLQPVDTVVGVLAAIRGGASINSASKTFGLNYRTTRKIALAIRPPTHTFEPTTRLAACNGSPV